MTSRWTPGALLLAMLALLVAGCGTGVPLVGNDDAGVVISFDQPMSDIGEPDDINYDGANDFVPGELPDAVLVDQTPGCVDNDRDGFGLGTCRGIDCDDRDPRITTQCYEGCFYPDVRDGCSCEPGTQPLPCDLTTGRSSGPDGVCNLGQRTCAPNRTGAGWSWGACERWRQDFRFVGPISACPGSCLPTCRHQIVCPTPADPASASRPAGSSGVSIGSGAQAVFCPTGTPNGGITSTCTPVMGTAYARGTTPPSVPWVDACAAPGHLTYLPGTDDNYVASTIPFAFQFYGSAETVAGISSNGILSFPDVSALSNHTNATLPYTPIPNAIFPFWDDLMTRSTGVCVTTNGTAPNRQYVVEWADTHFCCTDDPAIHNEFEVLLSEGTHTIDVRYNRMVDPAGRSSGSSATIGIQQGTGVRYDLVSFDTAAAVSSGSSIRWLPTASSTLCSRGVYNRVFDGDCAPRTLAEREPFTSTIPFWGQFNFTSNVPSGTSIQFEVRAADTVAGLASASPVRLADAPYGVTSAPVSVDLRAVLRAASTPGNALWNRRYLQLTAYLNPSADGGAAPTLISTETQYTCLPRETIARCQAGGPCAFPTPCHRGVIACVMTPGYAQPREVCTDAGLVTPGTSCGTSMVCTAAGACVPCSEGGTCSPTTADPGCATGRISCATGAPICNATLYPAGTPCGSMGSTDYIRTATAAPWRDVCALPGHTTHLPSTDDNAVLEPLPFPFRYYSNTVSSVGISSNGLMQFGGLAGITSFTNGPLPNASTPDTLFVFWDDLMTRAAGICTATVGLAPNRTFVTQWSDLHFYPTNDPLVHLNFQTALNEGTNTIDVLYGAMTGGNASGASATVGIQEGAGSRYQLLSYDTAGSIMPNSSYRWTPSGGMVCNTLGRCVSCTDRTPCSPTGNPCDLGITVCTSGVPTCAMTGRLTPGSSCGMDQVCNPAGACIPCQEGASCSTGVTCEIGAITCTTGVPTCRRVGYEPRNTTCVVSGGPGRCDGMSTCIPCGMTEICDGVDNNCNGTIDEGLTRACYAGPPGTSGVGLCRPGSQTCSAAAWTACSGQVVPAAERCNGNDDDCDGMTDEDFIGGIPASPTPRVLVYSPAEGSAGGAYPPGSVITRVTDAAWRAMTQAQFEAYNLIVIGSECTYANCQALYDTRNTWAPAVTGRVIVETSHALEHGQLNGPRAWMRWIVGSHGTGLYVVEDTAPRGLDYMAPFGAMTAVSRGYDPGNIVMPAHPAMVGVTNGDLTMSNNHASITAWPSGFVVLARPGPYPAEAMVIARDGGASGMGLGAACTAGMGACARTGTYVCTTDGSGTTCSATAGTPTTEVCDGVDNDCDGMTDEGLTRSCYGGPPGTAGVGACTAGVESCTAGSWSTCAGEVRPGVEVCDNADNDCDGMVDETLTRACYTGLAGTSGVGTCRPGAQTCTAGSWGTGCPGEVVPRVELCDGLDDNCNGTADDPFRGGCGNGIIESGEQCDDGNSVNTDACTNMCTRTGVVLAGNAQTYVQQAFSALGETYTSRGEQFPPPSAGGVLITSNDGGTSAPVDYNAFLNAGGHLLVIGGSNYQPYYDWVRNYLSHTGNVGSPGWQTLSCSPHYASAATHPITQYLPSTYTFPVSSASYHMVRFSPTQPSGTTILGNTCLTGDRGSVAVRRYTGGGSFTYLAYDSGNYGSAATVSQFMAPFLRGYLEFVRTGMGGMGVGGGMGLGRTCTAGTGACVRTGTYVCTADGSGTTCSATAGPPSAEVCDGVDNDCDGMVDEGLTRSCYTGPSGTAGVGACTAGTETCAAGAWGSCTGQVVPSPEVCDNVDNNCNGTTDESLTRACYTGPAGTSGVGICRPGTQTCMAGSWGSTCPGQVVPATELCNAIDDNCNGTVDDPFIGGIPASPTPRVLVYAPAAGSVTSLLPSGSVVTSVTDAAWRSMTRAQFESYNMIVIGPNCSYASCQGLYDTRNTWGPAVTGRIIVETSHAIEHTQNNGPVAWLRWIAGGSGTGLYVTDDDAQRPLDFMTPFGGITSVSDGYTPGVIVMAGHAAMAGVTNADITMGSNHASMTAWPSTFVVLARPNSASSPTAMVLARNGGASGTGIGATCTAGVGACARTGTYVCRADGSGTECSATAGMASPEVCDNVDNDCDGMVDEGLTRSCYGGPSGTAGVGACTAGTETCAAGSWGTCAGEVRPATEVCDNVDNNCNGTTDEALTRACYTGAAGTSGVGVCRPGTQTCMAGSWGSTCPGQVVPTTELCNALDDNCNGTVDDPFIGGIPASPTPRVLVYSPAEGSAAGAYPSGSIVTRVTDAAWRSMTRAQFETYHMIVIGSGCSYAGCQGLYDTRNTWGPAVSGRIIVETSHALEHGQLNGPQAWMRWIVGGNGTGLYVSDDDDQRPLDFMSPFGGITSMSDGYTPGVIVMAGHAAMAGVTNADITMGSNHASMTAWPSTFVVLARPNSASSPTAMVLARNGGASGMGIGATCTAGMGACARTGTYVCTADGSGTECSATAGMPTFEVCDNVDNDCDGVIDDSLTRSCYGGPSGTAGVGVCRAGTETCAAGSWSACAGEVRPSTEVCDNVDNDCDGTADETLTRSCYTGAAGTSGVGTCRPGTQTCSMGSWGSACSGEVVPRTELCDSLDDNCNGTVDDPFLSNTFRIDSLLTTGCAVVDHNGVTGDDRGGIAVSSTNVFYSGDSNGVRLPLNLSSQTGLGRQYDAITSNLRTGRVYSFGVNATTTLPYGGGTATHLIEIDGTTGALTGTSIALSTALSLPSGTGIFAGWDRVVVHNTSRVYSIALPSGTVTDLGAVSIPPHSGCESWAYWGVAEYFGGTLYITYVRDSAAIERMAVPSGVRTVVATFSNLSDMCSFTVSPTTNRWYFHHEGGSQFGGSAETIGYCGATMTLGGGGGPGTGLGDSCSAGMGACLRTGTVICAAGGMSTTCSVMAGAATAEVCDNIDNDCDGTIDDGLTRSCYGGPLGTAGVGACTAGTETCGAGAWGTCTGEVRPSAEVCDNVDNDCDSATDESLTRACYTGASGTSGVGVCRPGTQTCMAGSWGSTCPGQVVPTTELCNSLDDNCNGTVDEPFLASSFPSTGSEGAFNPTTNTVLTPGVHNFTTINIPSGVRVTTTGTGVLDLRATGDVTVNGIIDVSGASGGPHTDCYDNAAGSGGGETGNPIAVAQHGDSNPTRGGPGGGGGLLLGGYAGSRPSGSHSGFGGNAGGGGGGGYSSGGGGGGGGGPAGGGGGAAYGNLGPGGLGGGPNGGAGGAQGGGGPNRGGRGGSASVGVYNGVDGTDSVVRGGYSPYGGGGGGGGSIGAAAAADLPVASTFAPGSGGGGGGGDEGTGGGGGGGALRVASPTRVAVGATGQLLANGGSGQRAACVGGGGGGGSGGVVYVSAPTVNVASGGVLSAVGGTGGTGATIYSNTPGGNGGLGRVRIEAVTAACTLSGTINPPLVGGCAPTGGAGTAGYAYVSQPTGMGVGGACSAGVGGCTRTGAWVCNSAGTGVVCTAVAGTPSMEVCDGIDNDCDGATDEGFCRIGGTCFVHNDLNPSNNCQVCTIVSATASGPTVWSARPMGTACRGSAGVCDRAEVCDGTGAACPTDGFEPSTTECRASGGDCDPAERCTGSSALCPANALSPSSTVCRVAAGVCDQPENCTGSTTTCPTDAPRPSGTSCTPPTGGSCVGFTCTCGTGMGSCGGMCIPTGASCSVGVGACARTGVTVCTTSGASGGARNVTMGYQHACAVMRDGAVRCWGYNGQGQLGNGTTSNSLAPVTVTGVTTGLEVTGGYYHSCARVASTGVQCWGYNAYGQLGDGSSTNRSTAVSVSGLTGVVEVDAGVYHTCAVRSDGSGWCWGYNYYGQLGDLTGTNRSTPVRVVGVPNLTRIAAGGNHTCAVRSDGSLWCWGYNGYGQLGNGTTTDNSRPQPVPGLAGVVDVECGFNHTCAILSGGAVRCWGYNGNGQLGDGTTTNRTSPVAVTGIATAASITSGDNHTCARLSDSTVRCWGYNGNGALGDGTTTSRTTPVAVTGVSTATHVAAFYRSTCARLADETLRCWGDNGNGHVGDGTTTDRPSPTAVLSLSTPTACNAVAGTPTAETCNGIDDDCDGVIDNVAPSTCNACATGTACTVGVGACARTGTLICDAEGARQVTNGFQHTCARMRDGTVRCWGYNGHGELGNGSTTSTPAPVTVTGLTGTAQVAGGYYHTCARMPGGTVQCWGYNAYGQLGDNTTTQRTTPVATVSITNLSQISLGIYHTCGVRRDGSVWCWGYNGYGQLGDLTGTNRSAPVQVQGLANATSIASGGYHTCAIRTGGTVWCWGYNGYGQLGDGTTTDASRPVPVPGLANAVELTAGFNHTCARLTDGTVRCWGYNGNGQLGDGTATTRTSPVAVSGVSTAAELTAGDIHTCARLTDGTMRCWGYNGNGQLGNGTTTSSNVPVAVSVVATAINVSAFYRTTCAVLADESVRCWGDNGNAQVGDATYRDQRLPTTVVGLTGDQTCGATAGAPSAETCNGVDDDCDGVIDDISYSACDACSAPTGACTAGTGFCAATGTRACGTAGATRTALGYQHACALLRDGAVRCWGYNGQGQLGNGTTSNNPNPVSVSGLTGAVQLDGGYYHTCARLAGGTVQCWGYNAYGQLGDTTTTNRSAPVTVSGLSLATRVSSGIYHNCAARRDGTAWCWGYNYYGQLGDLTGTHRSAPVQVRNLFNVSDVAVGGYHSCAIRTGGTVWCWGYNNYGQLGNGTTSDSSRATPVPGLANAVELSAGFNHTCARLTDGTVRCWGYNGNGQLGDGTSTTRYSPVAVSGLATVVQLAASENHTCARLTDGTLRCWGYNGNGQLGNGTATSTTTPVVVTGVAGAVDIDAFYRTTCAALSDGRELCWGDNGNGQVGDSTYLDRRSAAEVLYLTPSDVTCSATATAPRAEACNAVDDNCNGVTDEGSWSACDACAPPTGSCSTGAGACVGAGARVCGTLGAVSGASTYQSSCAVLRDGSVRCWGYNGYGELGDGTTTSSLNPVTVSGLAGIVELEGGYYHRCARLPGGTVRCWGYNGYGQLGNASFANSSVPVNVSGLTLIAQISSGTYHNCGVRRDGTVWCWGYNGYGQLGDLTGTNRSTPVQVQNLANAYAVGVGGNHSCAIRPGGTVWCWGYNGYGQLGNGTTTDTSRAVPVPGLAGAVELVGGANHTCARLTDGTVRCWGYNGNGQLGDNTLTTRYSPVAVSGLSTAVELTGGDNHTCARLSDNTLRCWGLNSNGQLGDGTTTRRLTPVAVSGVTNAVHVETYYRTTCAALSTGEYRCWGDNGNGHVGDSTYLDRTTPVAVLYLTPSDVTCNATPGAAPTSEVCDGDDDNCNGVNDDISYSPCDACTVPSGACTAGVGACARTGTYVCGTAGAVDGALGYQHTCAVLRDNTVRCWGYNGQGQLGNGTTANALNPVTVTSLTGVAQITGGYYHTCAKLSGGTVRCWGYNAYGQLGDGTTTNRTTPVAISSFTDVTSLSAGIYHNCAARRDGTAWCWGYNYYGQLGDLTGTHRYAPVQVRNLFNVSEVTAGGYHSCAIRTGGTVWCWGYNNYGQLGDGTTTDSSRPVPVPGLANAVELTAGFNHTCARLTDGTVRCWGYNGNGQLGDGTSTNRYSPVAVSGITALLPAVELTAGDNHTCARLSDGTLRCWGYNGNGALGNGTTTSSNVPVVVTGVTGATHVRTYYRTTCATLGDGTFRCWGDNGNGQVGDGTYLDRTAAVSVLYLTPSEVTCSVAPAAAGVESCNSADDNCNGVVDEGSWSACDACAPPTGACTTSTGRCAGAGTRVCGTLGAIAGASTYQSSCALMRDGTARCWGYNGYGELGDGTTTSSLNPVTVSGLAGAVELEGGYYHRCARLPGGTVRCWGYNAHGELGNGSTATSTVPVSVSGLSNATQLSSGTYHNCAVRSDGTVWCWGYNGYGQLGDLTSTTRTTPVQTQGLYNASAVGVGGNHSCAIRTGGAVWCWGYNGYGQLGNGTTGNSSRPVPVAGLTGAVEVTAGENHTCARLSSGAVWCWGYNANGQLGDNTLTTRTTPVAVSGISTAVGLTAGDHHTCARLADNTLRCWGYNGNGALGDGTTTRRLTPVAVSGVTNAVHVETFYRTTCAALSTGEYRCWGDNGNGHVGDSTYLDRTAPVAVLYLTPSDVTCSATPGNTPATETCNTADDNCDGVTDNVSYSQCNPCTIGSTSCTAGVGACVRTGAVSCTMTGAQGVANGYQHTCARLTDGTARCWGYNGQGQLGDGTTSNNPNPVTVSGLANATQLTAGYYHSCARLSTSAVRCWGYNAYGQLGDNTTTNRSTPVTVSGLSATQVSAGIYHSCARVADGTARCWGYNAYGQLGDGTGTHRSTPVAVSGLTSATQVGAGGYHSCAVRTNGTVWCWGYNAYGQLGNGTTTDRATPVAVSGISTAVEVQAGFNHTCARLADGTARCWGYNGNGQLGDGTSTNRYTPVAVSGLSAVAQLTLGDNHTCARLTDGTARCWGYNGNGALGDGTTTSRSTPVAVTGFTGATDITAFYRTTCATRTDLTVHCWGDNGNGQVGDNTYLDRRSPTLALYVVPTDTLCGATPASPGAETCNGLDDDCNGVVDNDVTRSCYTGPSGTVGVGACAAGTETCVVGGGGTWGSCAGQVLPSAEICDNVDNDCDNIVDDGFCRIAGTCYNPNQVNPASTCQYCAGAANAAPPNVWSNYADGTACGSPTGGLCTSGVCGCPGGQSNCGGICRVTGAACSVGVGACFRTGVIACSGTGTACNAVAGSPSTESCNSVDDDCNGVIDNGPTTACASAIDLGTLNVGSIATRIEWIPAPAGSEQWYFIRIPQNADVNQHGTGTPQISIAGSASVRFDVVASCGSGPINFGTGGIASNLTSLSFADTASLPGAGAYSTRNVAWPAAVYVRVYRVSAPTTCATQTLSITRPAGSEYHGAFTAGVTPFPTAACTNWNNFRANINPGRTYTSITLRGSTNPTGRTCTGAAANTLCQALRTAHSSGAVSVSCGGNTWTVGQCYTGQVEVNADGLFCNCGSSWAARPCHQDPNFGGVGASSCGGPNQNIIVNCQ